MKIDMKNFPDFKKEKHPLVPEIEEIEHLKNGERALSPSLEWVENVKGTPKGSAMLAAHMIMDILGIPPQIIMTVVSIKIVDEERKIDYKDWITNRSNWSAEDKEGAIKLLDQVNLQEAKIMAGQSKDIFDVLKSPLLEEKKDDWNVN